MSSPRPFPDSTAQPGEFHAVPALACPRPRLRDARALMEPHAGRRAGDAPSTAAGARAAGRGAADAAPAPTLKRARSAGLAGAAGFGAGGVASVVRFFAFFGSGCARAQSSLCALATSSGRARTGVRCSCAVGQTVSSSS